MSRRAFCVLAVLFSICCVYAGGFLVVTNTGVAYKWDTAQPIPFNPDLGSLGALSNATAVDLVAANFDHWASIPSANITFANNGSLSLDVQTASDYSTVSAVRDGINPIVFDADGSLLEDLGLGASVLGFAQVEFIKMSSPFYVVEGLAVLNGRFIDGEQSNGELTLEQFGGVVAHELGHFLNLDHTQINGHFFLGDSDDPGFARYGDPPAASISLMFPIFLGVTGQPTTPNRDDVRAISTLYPANGFPDGFGTIEGSVFESNGVAPFQGSNLIVRNAADPFFDVASRVSGALYKPSFAFPGGGTSDPALEGQYSVAGLTAGGSYTVEIVEVSAQFTEGSSVGPLDPPAAIPGGEEFWNGAGESGDESDNPADSELVVANGTVSGIDLSINRPPVTFALNNFEEPVNSIASVQSLISSPGSANGSNDYAAVRLSIPASLDTPFTVRSGRFFNNDGQTVWPRVLLTTADATGQPDLASPLGEMMNVTGGDRTLVEQFFDVTRTSFADLFFVVQFPPGGVVTGTGAGGGPAIGGDTDFDLGLRGYYQGNLFSTDGVNFRETSTLAGTGSLDAINWDMTLTVLENRREDAFEPNDDPASAALMNYGDRVKAYLDPFGELDYFKFSGAAGDSIRAEVFARAVGSSLDGFLTLLDASGDTIAQNDDQISEIRLDPKLQAVLPESGDYFLAMDSWDRAVDNNPVGGVDYFYELQLDAFSAPLEPNDTAAQATPVSTGQTVDASIDVEGDLDFYSFAARENEVLTAQVTVGGSSIDPVLTLFDTDGTTVLASKNSLTIQRRLSSDGTFLLAMADLNNGGGADFFYQLSILVSEANLAPPTNLTVSGSVDRVSLQWDAPLFGDTRFLPEVESNNEPNLAQDLSGSLPVTVSGDAEVLDAGAIRLDFSDGSMDDLEDLYAVTTETTGLKITLTDLTADLDLYLFDGALADPELASSNAIGILGEEIDDPSLAAGTYFVAVTIYDPAPIQSSSQYTLTLSNDSVPGELSFTGFKVYRSETQGARNSGLLIADVEPETTTLVDSLLPPNTFYYQVTAEYDFGESPPSNEASAVVTSVEAVDPQLPTAYALEQNFPNPFNPSTEINYAIPMTHGHGNVTLEVFNMLGQKVRTLVNQEVGAGFHTVEWDGKCDEGSPVTSGLYLYRVTAGAFVHVKKMALLK